MANLLRPSLATLTFLVFFCSTTPLTSYYRLADYSASAFWFSVGNGLLSGNDPSAKCSQNPRITCLHTV